MNDGGCLAQDPYNSNVVYAGGGYYNSTTRMYSMAVLKSTNGGINWPIRRDIAQGDYRTSCHAIAVAPGDSSIVYAGGERDSTVAVLRSSDAGNSWTDITEGLDSMHSRYDSVYAIWVSPLDYRIILVGTSNGVFKRTVIGRAQSAAWNPTSIEHSTSAFAYDPLKGIVYASTNNGVFETDDVGSSWRSLNAGLDCLDTSCIAIDSDNGMLYVGTNGGSVWRLSISQIDLNRDGIVNFEDYAVLVYNWLEECFTPDWCQGGDLNRDGIVDFGDFSDLADNWLR